jgi:hypothetical protein
MSGPPLSYLMPPASFRPPPAGGAATVRRALGPLFGFVCLALAGCHSDEVTSYPAPHEDQPAYSLYGAIIPHGDKMWFVKVAGPAARVKALGPAFDLFVKSLHFPDEGGESIGWTVPKGWQRDPKDRPSRFATFEVGPRDRRLEVTVTHFPLEMNNVLDNVNRWRGQLGLWKIGDVGLARTAQQVKLKGAVATVVKLTGPLPPGRGGPMGGGRGGPHGAARPARGKPTYEIPPGWKELPPQGIRVASFEVREGEEKAEVTVIPLPGAVGGLLANVNRWRGEVGLPEIGKEELLKTVQPLRVAGSPAAYVDLTGPAGKRTLAVALPRPGQTWFFKMTGPADLVGRHKEAFEHFVASVRLPGGGGNER